MNAEIWQPAPFMKPMGGDQALGNIYEMRTYTYQPGSMPELLRRWAESLPYREEFSPLAAGMHTEFGGLNKWMHIWPYKDLNHRFRGAGRRQQDSPSGPAGRPGGSTRKTRSWCRPSSPPCTRPRLTTRGTKTGTSVRDIFVPSFYIQPLLTLLIFFRSIRHETPHL